MMRHAVNGIPYYSFEALSACGEVINAIFTRLGGLSGPPFAELNVGRLVGDDAAAVEANHRLIYATLNISGKQVVTARQVHGNNVAIVSAADGDTVVPETDGLITSTCGLSLMLRFADCLPIFLYDPQNRAIGLAHAGWRGTAARIAERMVSAMVEVVGSEPSKMIAGLGPAVGPCCYEVGPDVADLLRPSLKDWQAAVLPAAKDAYHVDLWEANRQQLMQVGLTNVEVSHLCTACHTDEFFSHRAEKESSGRFAAVMGIRKAV